MPPKGVTLGEDLASQRDRIAKQSVDRQFTNGLLLLQRAPESAGETGKMRVSGTIRSIALLFCAPILVFSFFTSGFASAPQQTLENVLKQLDAQAAGFKSLTADLDRTKVTVVVNDKSTQSGQISVRSDGKMRIELTQPDAETILRDGDNFYIYNPKIHRVEEYNLGKKKSVVDQFLLLGFGTSGSSLKESYTISLQGEETLDGHKVVRLDLLPKTDEVRKQLSKIQLWLDESTWLPVQQQFFETGSGDYFIIKYRNVNRNARIPDSQFKPRWPRGTTRIQPQG
jgi:outer membrane lipoprotein-sorting protein